MLLEEKHVCDSSRVLSPPTSELKTSEHNTNTHIHVKTEAAREPRTAGNPEPALGSLKKLWKTP